MMTTLRARPLAAGSQTGLTGSPLERISLRVCLPVREDEVWTAFLVVVDEEEEEEE
jgi:hypothetical protein